MIKESKIKKLKDEKIITLLDQELSIFEFKYQKSKDHFVRKENGFDQIISVYVPSSPFIYDEKSEKLYLTFKVFFRLEMPEYENWYLEEFGEKIRLSFLMENVTSQIELSINDFDAESFYEPTASQQFKNNVSRWIARGGDQDEVLTNFNDFLKNRIPDLSLNLSENSDILKIYNKSKFPFEYTFLLVYGGYLAKAEEEFGKYYHYLLNRIESQLKESETETIELIQELNELIKKIQKTSNLSLTNPFNRSIKLLVSKNDTFDFSQKTHFIEVLRLDISQFDIKSININSLGDVLVYTRDQKIIKLNSKAEILLETEIELRKGFDKIFWEVPSGVINEISAFYVNNFIITSDNKILELSLPSQKLKKGKLQNPHINDLKYWPKENKYLIVYEDNFLLYNTDGQLEKSINVGEKYGSRIIIEKEWILTQKKGAANVILNFDGKIVATYEFATGNRYFDFSSNYEYLICFCYSTKSQFYNLISDKKETLWAHPTFFKDYIGKMYNDIENNFGMGIAKFSPDNKYIVGGAYHGKYVAWLLPKLERVELIPKPEMIDLLEPHVSTIFFEEGKNEIVTKAELVNLGNQTFFKNRGNNISKVFFFENGDTFVTEIDYGKFVLSWDRNFNNLTFKRIEGKLDLHSEKYLTQTTKEELVIYRPE
ncbi:hypothetical protein GVN16_07225 [Emticicia sp. CRIBPO]|uniref:hypothetical protein n=1 Tax=Emticicia sp. CRIBPO TaxID=2683258 RepID=UPI0014125E2A|nr:hypothetical protein [Emticicia sp. CRIBPO]NBA85545.1 hypothetical protein [Emticicia sp. CRIBPO]